MNYFMILIRTTALIILLNLFYGSIVNAESKKAEQIFSDAKSYTVEIVTRIEFPFIEDKKGSVSGTGFLINQELGWILTNAHVVSFSPSSRSLVSFYKKGFVEAEKIYVDPYLDVAILQVSPEDIPKNARKASLGCESETSTGHSVGAFGHPWGYSYTGTKGIVSGISGKLGGELLQTDAPINVGNSGGPLISLETGKVIGINTNSVDSDQNQNTNFAEQIKFVCPILDLLEKYKDPSPPELPILFQLDLARANQLIVGESFLKNEFLKFKKGDVILEVKGVPGKIENEGQFVNAIRGKLENLTLKVLRDGSVIELKGMLRPEKWITKRRGLYFSGILISSYSFKDQAKYDLPKFMIHHVEPGSTAEIPNLQKGDFLISINGKIPRDLMDVYAELMESEKNNEKISLEIKAPSDSKNSLFFMQKMNLEVEDLEIIEDVLSYFQETAWISN